MLAIFIDPKTKTISKKVIKTKDIIHYISYLEMYNLNKSNHLLINPYAKDLFSEEYPIKGFSLNSASGIISSDITYIVGEKDKNGDYTDCDIEIDDIKNSIKFVSILSDNDKTKYLNTNGNVDLFIDEYDSPLGELYD